VLVRGVCVCVGVVWGGGGVWGWEVPYNYLFASHCTYVLSSTFMALKIVLHGKVHVKILLQSVHNHTQVHNQSIQEYLVILIISQGTVTDYQAKLYECISSQHSND